MEIGQFSQFQFIKQLTGPSRVQSIIMTVTLTTTFYVSSTMPGTYIYAALFSLQSKP